MPESEHPSGSVAGRNGLNKQLQPHCHARNPDLYIPIAW